MYIPTRPSANLFFEELASRTSSGVEQFREFWLVDLSDLSGSGAGDAIEVAGVEYEAGELDFELEEEDGVQFGREL
jgi:hypothetical protein